MRSELDETMGILLTEMRICSSFRRMFTDFRGFKSCVNKEQVAEFVLLH